MRIGVVAPSSRFSEEAAKAVTAIAAARHPGVEIVFHPQCFLQHNHFAGPDQVREDAFVDYANDPSFDALWFARGGYGSCRIALGALPRLKAEARNKAYLGYSDSGYLIAGLYRAGFTRIAHGPVAQDVLRSGGEEAAARALDWLVASDKDALEPGLCTGQHYAAFNMTVFGLLLGTPLEPDLTGHILLLEDVSEHAYRTDRTLFHITSNKVARGLAGLRLGRVSDVPDNDPPFGDSAEDIARFWCERTGIPYLGRADIGHDVANKIVPFGPF